MKFVFALLVYSSLLSLRATEWRPDARLLDAVCQVESSGGRLVKGDRGRSLGHFQMQKNAWADVVAWRKKHHLPTHDYRKNVMNARLNREYAANYLTILRDQLRQQYQREPSGAELYAAYNMGLANFRKCNYDLAQINSDTEARCRQVVALLE